MTSSNRSCAYSYFLHGGFCLSESLRLAAMQTLTYLRIGRIKCKASVETRLAWVKLFVFALCVALLATATLPSGRDRSLASVAQSHCCSTRHTRPCLLKAPRVFAGAVGIPTGSCVPIHPFPWSLRRVQTAAGLAQLPQLFKGKAKPSTLWKDIRAQTATETRVSGNLANRIDGARFMTPLENCDADRLSRGRCYVNDFGLDKTGRR